MTYIKRQHWLPDSMNSVELLNNNASAYIFRLDVCYSAIQPNSIYLQYVDELNAKGGYHLVHQIRNSVKYVGSKNKKEFLADLKCVYAALTKDAAELALDKLEEKWGEQYPIVIKSWRDKWENLSHYFQYTAGIRHIIYTTNTVEGYHRQVRKVTKTKGVFPSDDAVFKLVWLAYRNIKKKWTMPISNWGQTAQQLAIAFGDRFEIL